ncbi:hypothetical protein CHS0354_003997 [Potamilus streckersoni]|uniref:Uncharacterized protein n=1 Tax=Potamilus streckersoni TaxID=2493646 RepID=A0AAE0S0N2_9BIVA|nr:hypothetical protein CHS0354_003997 [Potamilus streckersoni]
MDTLAKWGTSLIVLINSVFAILGLVFLVCGMLVKVWPEQLANIVKMAGNFENLLPKGSPVHLADINPAAFLNGASTAFIIFGVVLLLVVVWGCCGACCKIRWMLIVYAVILAAIFLGEVSLVILFFTQRNTVCTFFH